MFIQTDMRVGGAEMLTANIIRRLDRERFSPGVVLFERARGRWASRWPTRFQSITACSSVNMTCVFGRS